MKRDYQTWFKLFSSGEGHNALIACATHLQVSWWGSVLRLPWKSKLQNFDLQARKAWWASIQYVVIHSFESLCLQLLHITHFGYTRKKRLLIHKFPSFSPTTYSQNRLRCNKSVDILRQTCYNKLIVANVCCKFSGNIPVASWFCKPVIHRLAVVVSTSCFNK